MRHLLFGLLIVCISPPADGAEPNPGNLRIAVFTANVTPPIGHGMMGGAWLAKSVSDPLEANGLVLLGDELPVVFVSVDWCEIRNDAYARWQEVLAGAAATKPERVLVTTIHQHDAPVADLEAERILRTRKLAGTVCDLEFHERAVQAVARALAKSLDSTREYTHVGVGQSKVDQVASNRRYILPDGSVRFDRTSSTSNPAAIAADEGLVDPYLKTLSFWDGETPLAAICFYAVHPMSYYGQGEISADFPGLARRKRQLEMPEVKQIYATGCGGNIVAGKYNTGAHEHRAVLAQRLHAAMNAAWTNTKRHPAQQFDFRVASLRLEPRKESGFTIPELEQKLVVESDPFKQCLAAMGLSWRRRVSAGRPILIPAIDFGGAQLLLLPGEAYVEYQLAAQQMRPDSFVCVAGYGDGATGYIPTDKHFAEGDSNLADWCWVAPGSEPRMLKAIREVLLPDDRSQTVNQGSYAESSAQLLFTSQGKTGRINVDGNSQKYFDFSVPNQATWQPGPVFPDGKRLIFLSMEPRRDTPGKSFDEYYTQTPTHLWIHDLTTGSLEEICNKERLAVFVTPALLLDDDRMLIQVVRNNVGQIYSVRLDGTEPREFTRAGEGLPYGLSVSPDGQRVAFHLASPQGYQIWISDVHGKQRQLIAADPAHLYFGTSWSPDGKAVLFVDCHYRDDPGHDWADVCVCKTDGSKHRVLTTRQAIWFGATYGNRETHGGGSNLPAWTHDGKILFPRRHPQSKVAWEYQPQRPDVDHFNRDYKPELARGGTEICRLDPRDGSCELLTRNEPGIWDFRAIESPDGRWIAFCRAATGEAPAMWVMQSDGSNPRLLTRGWQDHGADHPTWLSERPANKRSISGDEG